MDTKKAGQPMNLEEMAEGYRTAAVLLQIQIREERTRAKGGDAQADYRARQLGQILTELRKLRRLCAHYYDQPREPGWRL